MTKIFVFAKLCDMKKIKKRVKIVVQYVGTNYAGWQTQTNQKTIQGEIENAIKEAIQEKCEVVGSGRTDAGVHALAQVAHFDTKTNIDASKLCFLLNQHLPKDIRILSSEQVDESFHARFSTKQKTYQYNFYVSKIPLPCLDQNHAQVPFDFDILTAQGVLPAFVGTQNFKAFCASDKKSRNTTIRTIFSIKLWQTDKQVFRLEISGNGFLRNMVRIIAGTIIDVGCGKIPPRSIVAILRSKDRNKAGKTAPACGLTLKEVLYPVKRGRKKQIKPL